ncbi:MAG: AAA family ATPase [Muribaculaceae bacterium]|nr:AAA family ATPase [Muribaculaceae bacterium]
MLTNLIIKNYALIDDLNLQFLPGFTIITGETGAGKSIMLGALSLLLGERAESKAITDKTRKSVIEATFSEPDPGLKKVFEENGLE